MRVDFSYAQQKAPLIIWIVRICFLLVACYFVDIWVDTEAVLLEGQLAFAGFIGLSSAVVIASFIRTKITFILMILFIVLISLSILLPLVIFLRGSWLEGVFIFTWSMAIPTTICYCLWKSPRVRSYYTKTELDISTK